jgi:hypothetical protein
MKTMKRLRVLLLVFVVMLAFSGDAFAYGMIKKHNKKGKYECQKTIKKVDRKIVSAPLDGGLLTVLGAAGIAFYLIRKRKVTSKSE